MISWL